MRRRTFFMALAGAAGCTRDHRPRLNVYNWSDYVAPETIPNFEREFGVCVRYGIFESNEEMLAKVQSGNSGWDVVFPSNYLIEPMRGQGLLAELHHGWLANLDHLDTRFRSPAWDPPLRHAVPYMSGASGILFGPGVERPLSGWNDLWAERLAGRITMLDDPAEVLGACLKKLGRSLNSTDPRELDLARQEAIAQKRLVRAYLNAEVRDQVVAGDVLGAQLWATTSAQAIAAAPKLRFVYPAEGFAVYCDNAVILRESKRGRLAHEFLNYLLRPQVAAAAVAATRTATANAGAFRLLPEALRNDRTLYPAEETLARSEWFQPLSAEGQRLRDRIWTEIKSA